jgi:hypothetical protein
LVAGDILNKHAGIGSSINLATTNGQELPLRSGLSVGVAGTAELAQLCMLSTDDLECRNHI